MLMMLMLMRMPEYPLSSVGANDRIGADPLESHCLVHEKWHDRLAWDRYGFKVRINGIPHHSGGPAFSHPPGRHPLTECYNGE